MAAKQIKAESGFQLLARLINRPNISDIEPVLFPINEIKVKDVIELRGGPGSGKTFMATHLLAKCILSRDFGGMGAGAIFINTDHHFQLPRLVAMLEHFLKKGGCRTIQKELKSSLSLLTILACHDSTQLSVTLHALPQHLAGREEVSLLVFDSPSSYYWAEVFADGDKNFCSKQLYLRNILQQILSPEVAQQPIVFVYTVPDAFVTSKFTPSLTSSVTHHKVSLQLLDQNPETSNSGNSNYRGCFAASVAKHQDQSYNHNAFFIISAHGIDWLPSRTALHS